MAEDTNVENSGLQMEIIDKQGKVAFQGDDGQTSVLMKGVNSIANGDYKVVFTDGYVTSPSADVPATSASSTPSSLKSTLVSSNSGTNKSASASSSSTSSPSASSNASSATK